MGKLTPTSSGQKTYLLIVTYTDRYLTRGSQDGGLINIFTPQNVVKIDTISFFPLYQRHDRLLSKMSVSLIRPIRTATVLNDFVFKKKKI